MVTISILLSLSVYRDLNNYNTIKFLPTRFNSPKLKFQTNLKENLNRLYNNLKSLSCRLIQVVHYLHCQLMFQQMFFISNYYFYDFPLNPLTRDGKHLLLLFSEKRGEGKEIIIKTDNWRFLFSRKMKMASDIYHMSGKSISYPC